MLRLRVKPGSPFISCMGIKAHTSRQADSTHGAALFVSGLPLNFDESAVASVFACFGEVETVVLHTNKVGLQPGLFSVASTVAAMMSTRSFVDIYVPWSVHIRATGCKF